ncbi:MAG: F0F1 ATP synthase subunit delta [Verrucomicrobia bacterium]|nr:F0F1 ATP synthase subunit delta [Verrucomicrobiota bacterium]
MRGTREARRLSRHLLRQSFSDGKLDKQKVTQMVQTVINEKPRQYLEVLKDYQRLIRLEVEKRHAVIESATPLNRSLGDQIVNTLRARYGDDVTTEFRTNPELLGGLRIKIGNNVLDGSVRNRLNRLQEKF